MKPVRAWLGTLLAVGLAGCHDATGPRMNTIDLTLARGRWVAQGIHDYRYTLTVSCFCAGYSGPVRVLVLDDAVYSVTSVATGETLDRISGKTVDDLFAVVDRARRAGRPVEATFDPRLGYPAKISDNGPALALDGGVVFTAVDLQRAVVTLDLTARRQPHPPAADRRPR